MLPSILNLFPMHRSVLTKQIAAKSRWTLLMVLFTVQLAVAQKFQLSGTVLSKEDQLPVIGASIVEKGTQNGTITDIDGAFVLSVSSPEAILLFSYIGLETIEVKVAGQMVLQVVMSSDISLLDEVIVTGYKKEIRSEVSAAIASIKSKDIDKLVVQSVEQALQGQAPGVMVTQSTGAPGDDIAVRIRGAGTLGNNNPLYVIDGVPTTGSINMFAIGDVASIEILKDGAAAAIYGSRAANGVVLITTKRGASGQPAFSFDVFTGLQQAIHLPQLLHASDYLTIRNEAITNANTLRDPVRQIKTYDPAILDTLTDTDWLSKVFSTAPISHYALTGSGGNEHGSFYLSGDYQTQDGIFRGQKFDKYQLRFNGDIGSKYIRVGNNFSFSHTDQKLVGSSGDGTGAGNELSGIRYALIAAPVFSGQYKDGSPVKVTSELGDPTLFGDGNANPLVFIDNTDWTIKRYRVFGNVFAEINPLTGLKLRTSLGGDFLFENEKLFKERLSDAIYNPTSLNENRVFNQTLIWNNTADYSKTIGKHKIAGLVGMEAIKNHTDYLGASGNNFRRTDPLFRYLNDNLPADINNVGSSGIATEWSLLSFFSQLSYAYDSRYVLSASVRRDGSSRFGPNNRWGTFPSVSAAWNIANEPFFKNITLISSLKLRASWGQLGNQEIGVYPYSSLVQTGQRVYSFGDKLVTGATIEETGNNNVKWETTTQSNAGMDLSIWKDRLSIITDVFRKKTSDILVRVPIPQAGGSQRPPYVNAGSVENKGIELGLIYKKHSKVFNYDLGVNISALHNSVTSIAGSAPILGGFGLSDGPLTRTEAGYAIGSFYLWKMAGIFQSQAEIDQSPFQSIDTRPGDVKFEDLNGDNKIDDKDRNHFGKPFPDFTYGINASLSYKQLDFSILGQGIQGNDVYFLYGNFAYETQSRGFNSYADILNRWTPTNTQTDIPKVSIDDRNGNRRPSTRFLEDGSYFRIRNITLGYDLKEILKIKALGACRIYVTVQNAFTWTKYPGLDPEIQANANDTQGLGLSSDLAVGVDWGTVPAPRTQIIGIKLNF
ncbi:MAG: TonB-dependent receptor [Saprospiraceae bacterium]|nr:TonB-dependent receptor [Saprospiraceae bacterium]MBK7607223.1 TonB-dependent receptor [Saprospiraceae bacterium]